MTDGYYRGCDSAATLHNPSVLVPFFQFALRYLKYTTPGEIAGLLDSGIAVGLIAEKGAKDALGGPQKGYDDAQDAIAQAKTFGAPAGSGILGTVDMDTADLSAAQFNAVIGYCSAFIAAVTDAGFVAVMYACGAVLFEIDEICVPWLAGAMGWARSHEYDDSGRWVIKQGTPIYSGSWCGVSWPSIGIQYDPNLATNIDWAWQPDQPIVVPPSTLRKGDSGDAVVQLQTDLDVPWLVCDGDFGSATDYVVRGFQATKGLTPDGVVGPLTWAALAA